MQGRRVSGLLCVLEASFAGGIKETHEVTAAHVTDLVDTVVPTRMKAMGYNQAVNGPFVEQLVSIRKLVEIMFLLEKAPLLSSLR